MNNIKVAKDLKEVSHEESPVRSASGEEFGELQVEDLNCSIAVLGCSPVKLHVVAKINRIAHHHSLI
jgi:hypothetical protein